MTIALRHKHTMIVPILICAVIGLLATPVQASSCGDQLAQLRKVASLPGVDPSAPQSIAAQLGHQPTPASVQRAEAGARLQFEAMLAKAEALDAQGKHAECMQAVADARHILESN